jgi:hypothetical protein
MGDAVPFQLGQRLSHEAALRVVIGHRVEGRQGENVQWFFRSQW